MMESILATLNSGNWIFDKLLYDADEQVLQVLFNSTTSLAHKTLSISSVSEEDVRLISS